MIELTENDLIKKAKFGNTYILTFRFEDTNEITFEKFLNSNPIAYYWDSSTQSDRAILESNFSLETLDMVESIFQIMRNS